MNSRGIKAEDISRLWEKSKAVATAAWGRTSRRWRITASIVIFFSMAFSVMTHSSLNVPRLELSYSTNDDHPTYPELLNSFKPQDSPFNASKVALLIENRPFPMLAPLLLHFISVVPPDWRFRFMGSPESVASVNRSVAVRSQVASGKLDLTYIPTNMSTAGQEMISRFLTNLWLYETVLRPAEWLLVFQTDSILCANSRQNLNEYLDYDWVGAPWNPQGRYGGNGGLSLRRVSAIIDILRDQKRIDGSEPEDVWLVERLAHRPGARVANGTLSLTFSGEVHVGQSVQVHKPSPTSSPSGEEEDYYIEGVDDWRDGFYEPMGYHTGGSGRYLYSKIWGTPRLRKHMWDYCPEVKMTLAMDAAQYVPGNCNANWKRDGEGRGRGIGSVGIEDFVYGTEIIDGVEYPMLPPNLVPW